jgi:hypothetical protein
MSPWSVLIDGVLERQQPVDHRAGRGAEPAVLAHGNDDWGADEVGQRQRGRILAAGDGDEEVRAGLGDRGVERLDVDRLPVGDVGRARRRDRAAGEVGEQERERGELCGRGGFDRHLDRHRGGNPLAGGDEDGPDERDRGGGGLHG